MRPEALGTEPAWHPPSGKAELGEQAVNQDRLESRVCVCEVDPCSTYCWLLVMLVIQGRKPLLLFCKWLYVTL